MKYDPRTPKGKEAIKQILEKRQSEASSAVKRSKIDIESEPSGKLTNPSEIDRHRDRSEQ